MSWARSRAPSLTMARLRHPADRMAHDIVRGMDRNAALVRSLIIWSEHVLAVPIRAAKRQVGTHGQGQPLAQRWMALRSEPPRGRNGALASADAQAPLGVLPGRRLLAGPGLTTLPTSCTCTTSGSCGPGSPTRSTGTATGPRIRDHLLKDRLDVDEAAFWAGAGGGIKPGRGTPEPPAQALPADLLHLAHHPCPPQRHRSSRDDQGPCHRQDAAVLDHRNLRTGTDSPGRDARDASLTTAPVSTAREFYAPLPRQVLHMWPVRDGQASDQRR